MTVNIHGLTGTELQLKLDEIVANAEKTLAKYDYQKRYYIMREFAEWVAKQSCCNVCECIPCRAQLTLGEVDKE